MLVPPAGGSNPMGLTVASSGPDVWAGMVSVIHRLLITTPGRWGDCLILVGKPSDMTMEWPWASCPVTMRRIFSGMLSSCSIVRAQFAHRAEQGQGKNDLHVG